RAGDYSGTAVDVNSAGVPVNAFWSANEYANNGVWGTGLVQYTVSSAPPPPPPGAQVTASTPSGTVAAPVSSVVFTFSQAMDTSSSAPADVVSFTLTPTSGPVVDLSSQITTFSWTDAQHLQVNFISQSAAGTYRLVIGPQILNASEVALDQNQNGTPGEV